MNSNVVKLIKDDCKRNFHPKNRLFIYSFRLSQLFFEKKRNPFFAVLFCTTRIVLKITNITNHFPAESRIGGGLCLPHRTGIIIAGKAEIGKNCTIFHQVTIGVNGRTNDAPVIGDNVFIGAGAKILGGVHVGNDVRIGANAVVTKDVSNGCTVVGINKILYQ